MRLRVVHEGFGDGSLSTSSMMDSSMQKPEPISRASVDREIDNIDQNTSNDDNMQSMTDQYDDMMKQEEEQRRDMLQQPLDQLATTMDDIDQNMTNMQGTLQNTAQITPQILQAKSLLNNIGKIA